MTVPGREPTDEELRHARRVRRHREPRYGVFLATGAAVGVVAAAVLTLLSEPGARYSQVSVLGYLAVTLAVAGGLLGGLVAVLAARRR